MRPLSLRHSVVALALCCVLGAQLISTLVLLTIPYDAPRAMSIESALAAIDGPAAPGLEAAMQSRPPVAQTPDGYAQWVAQSAAALLGRSPSDIRVRPLAETTSMHQDDGVPSPGAIARQAGDPATAGALKRVPFPPFELGVASAGGRWRVVRPARSYLSDQHTRILLSFAVAIACLAPLIWWNARRLTRPLRFLGEASIALGEDPGMAPLRVEGPAEVRAALTAFNHMRAQLARHLSERATLMAALAHDLRTPLTSLRIRAEMAPDDDRRRMAADIARLDALVSDMLVFARGGRPDAARQAVDLTALCTGCVNDFTDLGQRLGLVATQRVMVCGDAMSLQRAIENVLSNALTYGQNVEVHVSKVDGCAEVHVLDEGPGLPACVLEQVFEPFFRLEASRSRTTGGTGLGLAIARAIARAHGGDVRLRNRETGGLDACLTLKAIDG